MSAPVFYLTPGELADVSAGQTIPLAGAEGHHAATVRRIAVGELVDVADGAGRRAHCNVLRSVTGNKPALELEVLAVVDEPVPEPKLVLVQALAKDGRDEQAIEAATELGVDEVVPWQADRSVVRWRPERVQKALAKWAKVVQSAAKQSRRARVPLVADPLSSAQLSTRLRRPGVFGAILHEQADTRFTSCFGRQAAGAEEVLLVVGPEGGISEQEIEQFTSAGASLFLLGPHVLRASTAGPAALALANTALQRW